MNRKPHIATTALQLFADKGFENTSTQLIAKEAAVSEALIFKYFGSKERLLDYIIKSGYKRVIEQNRGRLLNNSPQELVYKIIDLPYEMVREEPYFWKLQARLIDVETARKQHEQFLHPMPALLTEAFRQLGYPQPEMETRFLLGLVDALWKGLANTRPEFTPEMRDFIKTKYQQQT